MRAIYPPVASAEYADRIARAVEAGTLKIMPHWSSRAVCQEAPDGGVIRRLQKLYVPTLALVRPDAEVCDAA